MGNTNGPQMLYHPTAGVVMDIESANLKSAQINTKRKSERSVSPLPTHKSIQIDDSSKKPSNDKTNEKISENYALLLENLSKAKDFYIDVEFPAESRNISSNLLQFLPSLQVNQIVWARPSEIFLNTNVQLFKDDIIPNDIQQGLLGDCYFLSALAALAERPSFVSRLFESKETNEVGCYSLWLCIDGEWQNVIIDDFFPVKKTEQNPTVYLIFSRSNGPELWVLLLEKAYAKINGGYQNIEAGLCEEALRDLTGAPTQTLTDFTEKEAWEFLKGGVENNFLIVVSSHFEKKEGKTGGLISGHCYSILDIKEVTLNDITTENLIQLRNPWGHKEWTGDWSDDSNKWTEELRKELKWEKKDDGIFWMSCKDFCAYYTEISVCRIHQSYNYSSVKIKLEETSYKFFTFQINQNLDNLSYFTISQIDKRKLDKNQGLSYVRILLCRYENNEIFLVDENTGKTRDLCINIENLPAGVYAIFCEIENNNQKNENTSKNNLVLSAYSKLSIGFQEIKVDKTQFLNNLFLNFVKSHPKIHQKTMQKYEESNKIQRVTSRIADYFCICYFNETEFYSLKEDVEFLENTNFLTSDNNPIEKKQAIKIDS